MAKFDHMGWVDTIIPQGIVVANYWLGPLFGTNAETIDALPPCVKQEHFSGASFFVHTSDFVRF